MLTAGAVLIEFAKTLGDIAIDRLLSGGVDEVLDTRRILRESTGKTEDDSIRVARLLSGNAVAKVARLFRAEGGAAIADSSRLARIVTDTIRKADLSTNRLLGFGLRSEPLRDYLLGGCDGELDGLSESERGLVERAIAVLSEDIVEIAGCEPAAQKKMLFEIYGAQAELLDEARRNRRDREGSAIGSRPFEIDYARLTIARLNKFDLIGLPSVDNQTKRLLLSKVYVAARTERNAPDQEEEGSECRGRERSATVDSLGSASIEAALAASPRIFIQGDAGSGKTTLLQWIAVQSATQIPASGAASLIPFYLRLRDYASLDFPSPEGLIEPIARLLRDGMPKDWAADVLREGRAILLLDGFDEVGEERRGRFLEYLDTLMALYPSNRFVVSMRPVAANRGEWLDWQAWARRNGFVGYRILPMGTAGIEALIERWYDALSEHEASEEERERIAACAPALKRRIQANLSLYRLSMNPLICVIICALFYERNQSLPSDRLGLYEACVDMLSDSRDAIRGIEPSLRTPLSSAQKRYLLMSFAYTLHLNGLSDIGIEEADGYFGKIVENIGLAGISGPEIRRYFVERTGIVRELSVGSIDFPHRTFQEYLVSQAIIMHGDIPLLLDNALDDRWREVIILAAGQASERDRESLLEGILALADGISASFQRKRLCLMALACLETCVAMKPELRRRILETAAKAFPPATKDEAAAIAQAGDPVVPYLMASSGYSAQESAACVYALSIIGTSAALKAIKGYAADERYPVMREVGLAWGCFDAESFGREIMAGSRAAVLQCIGGATTMRHLGSVETLIVENARIGNLDSLPELGSLEEIRIRDSSVSGVPAFPLVEALRSFAAERSRLDGLGFLSGQRLLRRLALRGSRIGELGSLASLASLEDLELSECGIADIRQLSGLPRLRRLELKGNGLERIDSLAALRGLVELSLCEIGLVDLRPLAGLLGLERLEAWWCGIEDVRPIAALPRLAELGLKRNVLRDISALGGMAGLRKLDISETLVEDISALASLDGLEELDLSRTKVTSIGPLAGLKRLRRLALRGLRPRDLGALASIGGLESVTVDVESLDAARAAIPNARCAILTAKA